MIDAESPAGTTVTLANRNGGGGDNFTEHGLRRRGGDRDRAGAAPFTGSFRPVQPLSAFDGKASNGTWTLRVTDTAADDAGTLWSLGHQDARLRLLTATASCPLGSGPFVVRVRPLSRGGNHEVRAVDLQLAGTA